MRLSLFLLFSTIEFTSVFILTFAIFLVPIKANLTRILFTSLLLAQISFFVREELDAPLYAPFILAVTMVIFIWLLFRIQIFYSSMMVVFGYISFSLLQILIFFIYSYIFQLFQYEDSISDHTIGYFMQISCSIATIIISYLLIRKRIGFTFVPDVARRLSFNSNTNLMLLMTVLLAFLVLSILYFFISGFEHHILILGLSLAFTLLMLFYLAIRKEGQSD